VLEAEKKFLAARDAWHAARGEEPPPQDAPDPARDAERLYSKAREAWLAAHPTKRPPDR
jgi:hypothetical protein